MVNFDAIMFTLVVDDLHEWSFPLAGSLFVHLSRSRIQGHQWYSQLPCPPIMARVSEADVGLIATRMPMIDDALPDAQAFLKKVAAGCQKARVYWNCM